MTPCFHQVVANAVTILCGSSDQNAWVSSSFRRHASQRECVLTLKEQGYRFGIAQPPPQRVQPMDAMMDVLALIMLPRGSADGALAAHTMRFRTTMGTEFPQENIVQSEHITRGRSSCWAIRSLTS